MMLCCYRLGAYRCCVSLWGGLWWQNYCLYGVKSGTRALSLRAMILSDIEWQISCLWISMIRYLSYYSEHFYCLRMTITRVQRRQVTWISSTTTSNNYSNPQRLKIVISSHDGRHASTWVCIKASQNRLYSGRDIGPHRYASLGHLELT